MTDELMEEMQEWFLTSEDADELMEEVQEWFLTGEDVLS